MVSQDENWLRECAAAAGISPNHVDHATNGVNALKALRANQYDLNTVDDSITDDDIGAVEFCLNIRDLANNQPTVIVGGVDSPQISALKSYLGVEYIGPKEKVPEILQRG